MKNSVLFILLVFHLELMAQDKVSIEHFEEYSSFYFRPNISYAKDVEKYKPIGFTCAIPKGLKYSEIVNGSHFGFYYNAKQTIFIDTDLFKRREDIDTCFALSFSEIEHLVQDVFETGHNKKWDINTIRIKKDRKHCLISKGRTYILLLNIKKRNLNKFFNLMESFEIEGAGD